MNNLLLQDAKNLVICQLDEHGKPAAPGQPAIVPSAQSNANACSPPTALPECVVSAMLARTLRRPQSVAIDVGAHHGEFAKSILRQFEFDAVFAFEPHGGNFSTLQTLRSSHPKIVASTSAVGDHDGFASFGCNAEDATGSVLNYADLAGITPPLSRRQVPMVALDTFCHGFAEAGQDVRLIKIDTQGYDLNVLHGCEQTLRTHEPVVLLEFIYVSLYVNQAKPCDIEAWMRVRGYTLVGLANIHVDGNGALAFADALFVPPSVALPPMPKFRQIDSEDSWREQLATFQRICAERLTVIETLDAEVTRLKRTYEPSDQAA